jgi:nucleoside 2-deoxyribosyltransferase
MKLYLCGPITGQPELGRRAFVDGAASLRSAGYEVVSPYELHQAHVDAVLAGQECIKDRREYMAVDVAAMLSCDGVALLDGSERSPGAMAEVHVARYCHLDIDHVEAWLGHMRLQLYTPSGIQ